MRQLSDPTLTRFAGIDNRILMKFVRRMLCLTAAGLLAVSAAPTEERVWTGVNGRTFRGTFHIFEENQSKAVFINAANQRVVVALENLIPADRELLLGTTPTPDEEVGGGFKKLPAPDRSLIPDLDPKDLGARDDEALTDAIWTAILWWELGGIVEVPGRGDFQKRADWLHGQLSRSISRGGRRSALLDDGKEGVDRYFADHLADTAVCRTKLVLNRPTVDEIASQLTGARAVVIKMSMEYDNGRTFSIATTLESLTPDGKFVFHVFGTRLHGTVETSPDGNQEWVIANRDDIPAHYQTQGARFLFLDAPWHGLLTLEPFVFATKGKPSPLPPEEAPEPVEPAKPAAPIAIPGQIHPPAIATPRRQPNSRLSRVWNLTDGTRVDGTFHKMDGDTHVLRTPQGRESTVELNQLPPDERAALIFLRGCTEIAHAPRLDLVYHFNTPTRKNVEILISTDGPLGRLSVPSLDNHFVFNLADLTSASYRKVPPESHKPGFISKFLPEYLLYSEPRYGVNWVQREFPENLESFAQTFLGRSGDVVVAGMNALSLRFPFPPERGVSVQDLEMDFVQVNPPAALAALHYLLSPRGPGIKGGWLGYGTELSCHDGFDQIGPYLARTRTLPVRMKWRNNINTRFVDPNDRKLSGGSFSIELVRATSPDSFPADHFHIPAEAASLEHGHSRDF